MKKTISNNNKTSYLKQVLNLCLLASFALVQYACVQEGLPSNAKAELVDVDLSVSLGITSDQDITNEQTNPGTTKERNIGIRRIYAFKANGSLDKMEIKTPEPYDYFPLDKDKMEMEMTVQSGPKRFVVIANESKATDVKTKLNQITSITELYKVLYKNEHFEFNSTTEPDKNGNLLPLSAVSEPVYIKRKEELVDNQKQAIGVRIGRSVAKLELELKKATDNDYEVKLTDLSIVRTPKQSYVLPDNKGQSKILADGEIRIISDKNIELLSTGEGKKINPGYVWEYTPQSNKADQATAFKLVFSIKDQQSSLPQIYTSYIPIFYRDTKTGNVPQYSIRRNTYYNLKVKVKNSSLEIKYKVLDWNDEEQYDKIPGEDDSGVDVGDWDEQDPDPDTPENEKDFTFEVELQ